MKKLLYIALMAAVLAGCNKEDTETGMQGGEVSFRATMSDEQAQAWGDSNPFGGKAASRATDGKWALNDKVGVFAYSGASTLGANAPYNIENTSTGAMSAVEVGIYTTPGSSLDYYAYYPYSSNKAKVVVSSKDMYAGYRVDVTDQSDLTEIDLMWAKAIDQKTSDVALNFSHQLTKLVFNIEAGGIDVSDLTGMTATLTGATAKAGFDLKTGTLSEHTTADIQLAVTAGATTDKATITAIVAPMTDLSGCKVVFTAGSKSFQWAPATSKWVGGKSYIYDITVGKPKAKIGDYYYSDGTWSAALDNTKTPIGIVFVVNTDGKSGKIVSLDEPNSTGRWGDKTVDEYTNGVTGIRDHDDGATATKNLITKRKDGGSFATTYYAFNWIYATKNNNDVNGRWYLPARNELKALYAAMSGLRWIASGTAGDGEVSDIGWGYNTMPNYGSYSGARDAFNNKFTAASGTNIDLTNISWYWSSTENDSNYAWFVIFDFGNSNGVNKLSNLRVRAVSAF